MGYPWQFMMNLKLLFVLTGILIPLNMALAVPPPPEAAATFRTKYPQSTNLELMAEAKFQGCHYFIIWGGTLPPDGSPPDSDGNDEATIKKNEDGSTKIINGDAFTIPAENYLNNPDLCRALNDSFVSHRTQLLGGRAAMQKFLIGKTFMSLPEACAFKRAGFQLDPATRIFSKGTSEPYTTVGELFH